MTRGNDIEAAISCSQSNFAIDSPLMFDTRDGPSEFSTTRWSMVINAKDQEARTLAGDALEAADDAYFSRLAEQFRRAAGTGERVYVASRGDFEGMRLAFYLYPMNVHWIRFGPEIPGSKVVRTGELVAVMKPSDLEYDRLSGLLTGPSGVSLRVEALVQTPAASLYRVL